MTDQYKLTSIVCAKHQQFAWFLGAGTGGRGVAYRVGRYLGPQAPLLSPGRESGHFASGHAARCSQSSRSVLHTGSHQCIEAVATRRRIIGEGAPHLIGGRVRACPWSFIELSG